MASTQRRMAADARRLASRRSDNEKQAAQHIREALRRAHAQGVEEGRAQERSENSGHNARSLLLDAAADTLDQTAARASAIPNSGRAIGAFKEAASILRDAARRGEPAQQPAPEPEQPKRAKSTKKAKSNGDTSG